MGTSKKIVEEFGRKVPRTMEQLLTLPGVAQTVVLTRTSGRASAMPSGESLTAYAATGATAPFRARTMNEPGLTHLSISVDDVRGTAEKVAEFGGMIIEETDVGAAIFVRDPDGQLLELLPAAYRGTLPPKP